MPGVAVVGDEGGIPELADDAAIVSEFRNAACVADDGYARHGVGESHDNQGWAILLINTIILSLLLTDHPPMEHPEGRDRGAQVGQAGEDRGERRRLRL